MARVVVATRGSQLALWQARHVARRLKELEPELEVELSVIHTRGDKILDVPLSQVGGKGLFVKEIEEALLDGRADLAVHSMKDVPMQLPEGLVLGSVPRREDFTDCLCSEKFASLEEIPIGSKIGTSSLRRQAQLLGLRPDLEIVSLRGNVDTRLKKLKEGQFDAIVLASAGLGRLGLEAPFMSPLAPAVFVPAVGQGALGIECRANDARILELVGRLEDRETRLCVRTERAFLAELDGGCQVPIGAHAELGEDGTLTLDGLVAEPDGSRIFRKKLTASLKTAPDAALDAAAHASVAAPLDVAVSLGRELANLLKERGAGAILARLYGEGEARA